jgi:hypothetical protein
MWRYCGCGYDFGSGTRTGPKAEESLESQQGEWLTWERVNRFLCRLFLVAVIALLVSEPFPSLRWLTSSSALILALLFWAPLSFFSRERRTPNDRNA